MKQYIANAALIAVLMTSLVGTFDQFAQHTPTAQVQERMLSRVAEMKSINIVVEHNYADRHDAVPDEYTASFGPWQGRPATDNEPAYANVPDIPTITNLLVMEEEFAHAQGSDETVYGTDPIHQMWEEFRAKRYAMLKVSEFIEVTEEAIAFNEFTRANYIAFARQMSQYTRRVYSDDLIAAIRADAEAVAEAQYKAGVITITNSNDRFSEHYTR